MEKAVCHSKDSCTCKGTAQHDKQYEEGKIELSQLNCKFPLTVADLPPELFYSYNPSAVPPSLYRVLPLPTKLIYEEQIQCRLSVERNPNIKDKFAEMRRANKFDVITFPSMNDFHFDRNMVRYTPATPKLEWKRYRPDTAPVPYEGNTQQPATV